MLLWDVVQEAKAEKSIGSIKKNVSTSCKSKKKWKIYITICRRNVVPGDIVILEAGNYVPADCRLISSYNLKVEESSLTGEIVPILKGCKYNIKRKYFFRRYNKHGHLQQQ